MGSSKKNAENPFLPLELKERTDILWLFATEFFAVEAVKNNMEVASGDD